MGQPMPLGAQRMTHLCYPRACITCDCNKHTVLGKTVKCNPRKQHESDGGHNRVRALLRGRWRRGQANNPTQPMDPCSGCNGANPHEGKSPGLRRGCLATTPTKKCFLSLIAQPNYAPSTGGWPPGHPHHRDQKAIENHSSFMGGEG